MGRGTWLDFAAPAYFLVLGSMWFSASAGIHLLLLVLPPLVTFFWEEGSVVTYGIETKGSSEVQARSL